MRRRPIPFKFKVLRPEPGRELIYLPKLGVPEVEGLAFRLRELGFDEPRVINDRPKVLKIVGESATLRLMPRGLLIGPQGTLERLGPSLDIHLSHLPMGQSALSWIDNDYQSIVSMKGGLILHLRGRHTPPLKRFSADVSRMGPTLSADEALMTLATVKACGPKSIELLTNSPGRSADLSQPIRLEAKGFLHHVELSTETFLSKADEIIDKCLVGACPFSPLPDSTVRLKGGSFPADSKELEGVLAILENWISDSGYLATPLRGS